ncbi:MAG TPA: hypothetical protein VMG34_02880 [Bacteroidota bacterium]|nr:hypothetical protein [Bacteroidota bacterium]
MSEKKKFLLRVDGEVYAALEKWAADDLRSVNAQIEYLLTDLAKKTGRLAPKVQSTPPPASHNDATHH